jgi:hypothetical protein
MSPTYTTLYTHQHDTDDGVDGRMWAIDLFKTQNKTKKLVSSFLTVTVFNLFVSFFFFLLSFVDSGLWVSFRQIHPTPRIRTAISLIFVPSSSFLLMSCCNFLSRFVVIR